MRSFIFSYKNGCSYSPLLRSPVDAANIIEGMTLSASVTIFLCCYAYKLCYKNMCLAILKILNLIFIMHALFCPSLATITLCTEYFLRNYATDLWLMMSRHQILLLPMLCCSHSTYCSL